jgi:hypothetical protein
MTATFIALVAAAAVTVTVTVLGVAWWAMSHDEQTNY